MVNKLLTGFRQMIKYIFSTESVQVLQTTSTNARMLASRRRPLMASETPCFSWPDSQVVTANQIYEPDFVRWAQFFGGIALDRKIWEYCYIARALEAYVDLSTPKRGLVFGAGKERLPALLARDGHQITATDLPDQQHDWQTRNLDDLHHPDLTDRSVLERQVAFRAVDMNDIPSDLSGFDFLWSTGSLEHIGSHANGMRFVERAMDCLVDGGIAVHTTEFTITSETVGKDHPELSFYCRADIERLAERLLGQGHSIVLNFTRGGTVADMHADTPPYEYGRGLTAHFHSHIITSIGLIIQRGR